MCFAAEVLPIREYSINYAIMIISKRRWGWSLHWQYQGGQRAARKLFTYIHQCSRNCLLSCFLYPINLRGYFSASWASCLGSDTITATDVLPETPRGRAHRPVSASWRRPACSRGRSESWL